MDVRQYILLYRSLFIIGLILNLVTLSILPNTTTNEYIKITLHVLGLLLIGSSVFLRALFR